MEHLDCVNSPGFIFRLVYLVGTIFGLIACIIQTTSKKITEALTGLHDLLDLLTHGVVEKIPRFNKNIPRNQLEDTFDGIGKNFLEQLKLKQGVTAFLSRVLFGTILKVIKFFFLDDVVDELSKDKFVNDMLLKNIKISDYIKIKKIKKLK